MGSSSPTEEAQRSAAERRRGADLPAALGAGWPLLLTQAAESWSRTPCCEPIRELPRLTPQLRALSPAAEAQLTWNLSGPCKGPETVTLRSRALEAHLTNAAGEQAQAAGDLRGAAHAFSTALLLDPANAAAGLNLAALLLTGARPDHAREVLLSVLRLSPLPLYARLLDHAELLALVSGPASLSAPRVGRARLSREALDSAWVALDPSRTILATLSSSLLLFQGTATAPFLSRELVLPEDLDEDEQLRPEALGRLSARIAGANRLLAALGLDPLQQSEMEVGWAEQYGELTRIPLPRAGLRLEALDNTVRLLRKQALVDEARQPGAGALAVRWGAYVPSIRSVVYQWYRRSLPPSCARAEGVGIIRLPL